MNIKIWNVNNNVYDQQFMIYEVMRWFIFSARPKSVYTMPQILPQKAVWNTLMCLVSQTIPVTIPVTPLTQVWSIYKGYHYQLNEKDLEMQNSVKVETQISPLKSYIGYDVSLINFKTGVPFFLSSNLDKFKFPNNRKDNLHDNIQKQSSRGVLWKRCSYKFHKINRKTPVLENKI